MRISVRGRAPAGLAVAALVLFAAGCGEQAPEAEEATSTSESAQDPGPSDGGTGSDAGGGPSDGGTAGVSPGDRTSDDRTSEDEAAEGPAQNDQDCGPILDGWRAVIGSGDVDCETAVQVVNAFHDTAEDGGWMPPEADVSTGWRCESVFYERHGNQSHTYSMWCTKGADIVLTIADGTPVLPGTYVDPRTHVYDEPGYNAPQFSFTSPSGKWQCGILDEAFDQQEPRGEAGCHGPMPEGNTGPTTDGSSDMQSDSIGMFRHKPPEPWVAGELTYFHGPELAYGHVLYAHGFACTIQQDTGVTCASPENRFTVSSTRLQIE